MGGGEAVYHSVVGRGAADPAEVPEAAESGGWDGIVYYRLHGSPQMYYSAYDRAYLMSLAASSHIAVGE